MHTPQHTHKQKYTQTWQPISEEFRDKHVLANILRSHYVVRTPPLEARSPDRRSNIENAPRRRPVTGQQRTQTPSSVRTMSSYRGMDAQACN